MRGDVPTLAEYLGSSGYATAGFVGNTFYCAYDSGLDRGFTHYQDYRLDWAVGLAHGASRGSHLEDHQLADARTWRRSIARGPGSAGLQRALRQFTVPRPEGCAGSSTASSSSGWREIDQSRRPFFAFLNYVDAHAPYTLPPGVGLSVRQGAGDGCGLPVPHHGLAACRTGRSCPGRRGPWRWTPTIVASPRSTTDWVSSSASCNVAACSTGPS